MAARRGNPVVVLVAVATVVAVVLALVWRVAVDRATVSIEPPDTVDADGAGGGTVDDVALTTPVLSFRRAPGVLSRSINLEAFAAALDPLVAKVPSGSCLAVSVDGFPVVEVAAERAVVPASTQKVLVAAVALEQLGPQFRFRTTVVGEVDATGTVVGDLFLVGGGDPVLSSEWWTTSGIQAFPPTVTTSIEDLADQVVAAGVRRVTGGIVGDGTRYDDEWYVPSWLPEVRVTEAGPYDALLVNDARTSTSRVADDPVQGAANVLYDLLRERGVAIGGEAVSGTAPFGEELAVVESPPLTEIVSEMLVTSDNNTAELLVKEIGLAVSGEGTRSAGLDAIRRQLVTWEVPVVGLELVDGSGLSNDDQLTCATLLAVLQQDEIDEALSDALPVAATTGTLVTAFVDTPMAGVLRAKTGTLNNADNALPAAKALAGYVPVEGGGSIEFVLVLNGQTVSDQSVYEPIWYQLLAPALATYLTAGGVADLAPG
jgi:D-alanyl-D-alanine carboxypeptidase/D-alanyl-D-alanine-endopeptidase (penicillin-binding protein 4)